VKTLAMELLSVLKMLVENVLAAHQPPSRLALLPVIGASEQMDAVEHS